VCGHGPDAAALGATLRTAWRTLVLAGTATDDVLPLLERVLEAERWAEEIFTTVSQVAVAPDRLHADLYLAGHPVPLLLGPPSRLLPATLRGRALGVPVPGTWLPQRLDLGPRWRLMMYTDGIIEATVAGGRIGKQGLVEVVDGALAAGSPSLVEDVIAGVRDRHGGQLADDAAAVVLGWGGRA
jgi:serine phosphatase RsbU (regulator of sigma subunit)